MEKPPEFLPVENPQKKTEKVVPVEAVIHEPKKEERLQIEKLKSEKSFFEYLEQNKDGIEEEIKKLALKIRPAYDRSSVSLEEVSSHIKSVAKEIHDHEQTKFKEQSKLKLKKVKDYSRVLAEHREIKARDHILEELNKLKGVLETQKKEEELDSQVSTVLPHESLSKNEGDAVSNAAESPKGREGLLTEEQSIPSGDAKISSEALPPAFNQSAENFGNGVEKEKVTFVDFELTPPADAPVRTEASPELPEPSLSKEDTQELLPFDEHGPKFLSPRHEEAMRKLGEIQMRHDSRYPFSLLKGRDRKEMEHWEAIRASEETKYKTPEERAEDVRKFQEGRPEPEFPHDEIPELSYRVPYGPGVSREHADIIAQIGELQTRYAARSFLNPLKFLDRAKIIKLEEKRSRLEREQAFLMRQQEAVEQAQEHRESQNTRVRHDEEEALESVRAYRADEVLKEKEYEQSQAKGAVEDKQEAAEVEREIKQMSPEERESLGRGIFTLGFRAQELKDGAMAKACEFIAGDSPEGGLARFFKAAAEKYGADKIEMQKKMKEAGESLGVVQQFRNTGYLLRNTLSHGRNVMDVLHYAGAPGLSMFNPLRWYMLGAQAFSFVAGTGKEARLMNPEVMERQRGNDKDANYIDEAANEAWKIYEQARKNSKNGRVDKESLERTYKENLPEILLDRLKTVRPGMTTTFMQKLLMLDVQAFAKLGKKAEKISPDLLWKSLADYDRFVGYCGTVDGAALALHHAELLGRAGVTAMSVQTAYLLVKNLPHILGNIATFSSHIFESGEEKLTSGFEAGKEQLAPLFEEGKTMRSPHDVIESVAPEESAPLPSPPAASGAMSLKPDHVPSGGSPAAPFEVLNSGKPEISRVLPEALAGSPAVVAVDGVKVEIPEKPLLIGKNGPEGAIIKHLVSRHPQEISPEKAGWLAHRMFDRFMNTEEAKNLMTTHGIKDKEGLMKLMTRIKEGNVEIDASGNMHLRNISFIKAAASRVAEVSSAAEVPSSTASLPEELPGAHPEAELERTVNIPGANQDLYEGRTMILEDQGVPKGIIDSISPEDLGGMSREEFEKYGSRVETFLSSGISSEDLAHLRPADILGYSEDQVHEIVEHTHKVIELKDAGIHDDVIEKLEKSQGMRGLTIEKVSGAMTVPPGELVLSDARITIHGGRIFVQDYGTSIGVETYINPDFREALQSHNIKNIPVAEKVLQGRARLIHIYEKAIESYTKLGASAADKQRAGMIKKALEQLIARTEKQYGDVFKN